MKKLVLSVLALALAVGAWAAQYTFTPDAVTTVENISSTGVAIGKGKTAAGKPLDVVGTVKVSSSTNSSQAICFAGAFSTLPTTGYSEGCLAYQLSDHTLYTSTQTVTASTSWKAVY